MLIAPFELIEDGSNTIIQCDIEVGNKKGKLWYSLPYQYRPYLTTEKMDSFVVGLLLLAMRQGEDIVVKGSLSEKLYYNLTQYYMRIVQLVIPSFKIVRIIPDSLDDGKSYNNEGAVGTGFSAGVDSLTTVYDHLLTNTAPHYKISHLTFHNVGGHGEWNPEKASLLFHSRYNRNKEIADNLGLDLIKIDSNLSDILRMNFELTHMPRNVSCILLLQKLFSKFYYSAAFRYQDHFIGKSNSLAYADSSSIHLLSTETLEFVSTGAQYSRIEKTRRIQAIRGVRSWLDVCVRLGDTGIRKNCSECHKCLRTLFTLELLGLLEGYGECFDLEKWYKIRDGYIIKTVLSDANDPLVNEMREYARGIGYSFTARQQILSKLNTIWNRIRLKLYLVYSWMPLRWKRFLQSSYNALKRVSMLII